MKVNKTSIIKVNPAQDLDVRAVIVEMIAENYSVKAIEGYSHTMVVDGLIGTVTLVEEDKRTVDTYINYFIVTTISPSLVRVENCSTFKMDWKTLN